MNLNNIIRYFLYILEYISLFLSYFIKFQIFNNPFQSSLNLENKYWVSIFTLFEF